MIDFTDGLALEEHRVARLEPPRVLDLRNEREAAAPRGDRDERQHARHENGPSSCHELRPFMLTPKPRAVLAASRLRSSNARRVSTCAASLMDPLLLWRGGRPRRALRAEAS